MIRLGLAAALLITPLAAGCGSSGKDDGGGGFGAEVMCEEFVKDKLQSPASAEFSDQAHNDSKYGYRVTGIVDSENGFGAMLRADYACELKYVGADKWRAKNVEVIPR